MLKSVNLQLQYVPRCFRNQMLKKVERKLRTSSTRNEKKEIVHYYLTDKVKKINGS